MTQLEMTGSSMMLGLLMMHIAPSPAPQSQGQITQIAPGVDFPDDSFFDIFFEIKTNMGVLHNQQPLHMQAVIDAIPPINDTVIYNPFGPIALYNSSTS